VKGRAKQLVEDERFRRIMVPAYRFAARAMVFNPGPRVLVNGMAKTGTHLASSLLKNLPRMMFSGRHYSLAEFSRSSQKTKIGEVPDVDWERLRKSMALVNDGQFMTSHFPGLKEIFRILQELDYRTVVIMRDPRDVVVSAAFFITRLRRHELHERFNTEMNDMSSRLMSCIQGMPADHNGLGMESIGHRTSMYLRWLDAPDTHICRFEDLVGTAGGGSDERQLSEVLAIAKQVGRSLTLDEAKSVARKTWSVTSPTFRKGTIGDWRNHFEPEHKTAFKELAGQALIELGYENDMDW
jgi:sulfotransferase 6B1